MRLRLLLIEDNQEDAELVRRNVMSIGDLTIATTRPKYEQLLTKDWDCILADFKLPDFEGVDVITIPHAINPELPIIVVSGAVDQETVLEALRAGAVDFVFKDRISVLPSAIKRAVDHRKTTTEARRKQRLSDVGALEAGISHDMNNAIAPIVMAIPIFRDALPQSMTKILNVVEHSVKRIIDMQLQILAFARGDENRFLNVNLDILVRQTTEFLRHTIDPKIQLHVHIEAHLPKTFGNYTQLSQLLVNLCLNARDAVADVPNPQIDIEVMRSGNCAHICVTDNGTGIHESIIEKIWIPFWTTKPEGKGTGLGLAQVKKIVDSHNGGVAVASVPGRTEFHVVLAPPKGATETEVIDRLPSGKGELILMVDDEAAILEIARITLEDYGYKVLTALTAIVGCDVFRENQDKIFAVLTDLVLPCIGGPQLISTIRSMAPQSRIIAMSGGEPSAELESLKLNGFLKKPYTTSKLLQALDKLRQ